MRKFKLGAICERRIRFIEIVKSEAIVPESLGRKVYNKYLGLSEMQIGSKYWKVTKDEYNELFEKYQKLLEEN